jgi:hypothetical protein
MPYLGKRLENVFNPENENFVQSVANFGSRCGSAAGR